MTLLIPKHTALRAAGYQVEFNHSASSPVDLKEADMQQCCHCAGHFKVRPGSGTIRGWCTRCNGVTCGSHGCMECYPAEARLADYERGKLKALL